MFQSEKEVVKANPSTKQLDDLKSSLFNIDEKFLQRALSTIPFPIQVFLHQMQLSNKKGLL